MTTSCGQPEALRLADAIDPNGACLNNWRDLQDAAAELRRLHAQRDVLLEALKSVVSMVERHAGIGLTPAPNSPMAKARAAIAAAEGQT